MTSCTCKNRTHRHLDEPCENIGSELNGLCHACDAPAKRPARIAAPGIPRSGRASTRTKTAGDRTDHTQILLP